jgi:hypothetical protein
MPGDRVKKGDLLIDLQNRDLRYRLHAQKGSVAPEKMDRIHERIHTLMYWVTQIGDDEWPIPEPPRAAAETKP